MLCSREIILLIQFSRLFWDITPEHELKSEFDCKVLKIISKIWSLIRQGILIWHFELLDMCILLKLYVDLIVLVVKTLFLKKFVHKSKHFIFTFYSFFTYWMISNKTLEPYLVFAAPGSFLSLWLIHHWDDAELIKIN